MRQYHAVRPLHQPAVLRHVAAACDFARTIESQESETGDIRPGLFYARRYHESGEREIQNGNRGFVDFLQIEFHVGHLKLHLSQPCMCLKNSTIFRVQDKSQHAGKAVEHIGSQVSLACKEFVQKQRRNFSPLSDD